MVFGIIPKRRSASLRNERSAFTGIPKHTRRDWISKFVPFDLVFGWSKISYNQFRSSLGILGIIRPLGFDNPSMLKLVNGSGPAKFINVSKESVVFSGSPDRCRKPGEIARKTLRRLFHNIILSEEKAYKWIKPPSHAECFSVALRHFRP